MLRGFLPVVSVSINGGGPFDFLVDTGTNTTLVEPALATELGLVPADRLWITTLTGSEVVPRYFVDEMRVGEAKLADVELLAAGLDELHRVDKKIRGILGTNFLTAFSFRLDYEHHRLELFVSDDRPEATGGVRVPVELSERRMLITVESKAARGGAWKLALDSGVAQLVVFEDRFAPGFTQDGNCTGVCATAVHTNSFRAVEAAQRTMDIAIGKTLLRDRSVAVMPVEPGVERPPEDGLLPAALFSAIVFDRVDKSVVLNPR